MGGVGTPRDGDGPRASPLPWVPAFAGTTVWGVGERGALMGAEGEVPASAGTTGGWWGVGMRWELVVGGPSTGSGRTDLGSARAVGGVGLSGFLPSRERRCGWWEWGELMGAEGEVPASAGTTRGWVEEGGLHGGFAGASALSECEIAGGQSTGERVATAGADVHCRDCTTGRQERD